jgi:hypothetical protein
MENHILLVLFFLALLALLGFSTLVYQVFKSFTNKETREKFFDYEL